MSELDDLRTAFPLTTIDLRPHLRVRPLVQDDLDQLEGILSGDPDMSWSRSAWSRDNVQYLLTHRLKHYEQYGFGPYGVILDGQLIGMAGVQMLDDDSKSVELLVYISKNHWGQGLATELCRWSLARLEAHTLQDCVFASTRPDNERAGSMTKRLGFEAVGNKQEHYGHEAIIWRRNLRNG